MLLKHFQEQPDPITKLGNLAVDAAQLSEATMQAIADRVLDQLKLRQPTPQDSGSSAESEFSTPLRLSSLPP